MGIRTNTAKYIRQTLSTLSPSLFSHNISTFPVEFKNNKKETLRGFIHKPHSWNKQKRKIAVIFLHGFPGSIYGTAARLTKPLAKKGFLTLRFNFSGSDISDGKFEDKTMSQEVKDIKYAINFIEEKHQPDEVVLIGHSTGAIDAALYAHSDHRVSKLILLGGLANLDKCVHYDFTARQVKQFHDKGYIIFDRPDKEWLHKQKLKKKFYDEFFTLDIKKAMRKNTAPTLIVHAEKDEMIELKEAKALYESAKKPAKKNDPQTPAKLVIVKDADHRFKKNNSLDKLLKAIQDFLR